MIKLLIVQVSSFYEPRLNYLMFNKNNLVNDMKITSRFVKQEVCYVKAPKDIDVKKYGKIICDNDIGVHFRPENGNRFLIGNLEPPCDEFHWVDCLDTFNNNFSEQYMEQIYRGCLRMPTLPIPSGKDVQGIVCNV